MRIDVKKHLKIINLALKGHTMISIGEKFGLSKARISQILNLYNIDPRVVRREKRYNKVLNKIKKELKNSGDIRQIRNKFNLKQTDISYLLKQGVDLRLFKKEEIKLRDEKCYELYKKGLTAYEILDEIPELKTPNRVYFAVCKLNGGKLPKRINTRTLRSRELDNKIVSLKKKYSYSAVTQILNSENVNNLNGNKFKIATVVSRFTKIKKKNK
jgi:hypothetical protein